jgi:farnesyl-diphosphate farnesyltransferase
MTANELKSYLEDVSRTFALSISYLEDLHQKHSTIAYLLCRIPDTIEDSQLPTQKKNSLLHTYQVTIDNKLDGSLFVSKINSCSYNHSPDWSLVENTEQILEEFYTLDSQIQEIICTWVSEMTSGMKHYVSRDMTRSGVHIHTRDDLETYCYYVAGTIGNMIGELLEATYPSYTFTPELRTHATNYGLYLQLINVSKDVYTDYTEENTVYLPETVLQENGFDPSKPFLDQHTAIENSVENVVSITEGYEDSAQIFLESVHRSIEENYQGWAIPYELAVETRDEVYNSVSDVATQTPIKINRSVVGEVVKRTQNISKPLLEST